MPCVMLIDDEEGISLALRKFFEKKGYDFINAYTGKEGLETSLRELPDAVLLDLHLPDVYGITILKELKAAQSDIVVIVLTGYGEIKEAVEAIKLGAEHYLQKPTDLDELSMIVERNLLVKKLRQEAIMNIKSPFPMVGRSRQIQGLIHIINLMAENPSTTILLEGETGTGKELVARNIHLLSNRGDKPFVDINCASIPEQIFESELCGYEAGAFTDARATKKGLLEVADSGTLFLDEVAEMPITLQSKLLRIIETKVFRRVGGTRDIKIDIRVIAATNKDLAQCIANGSFRDDLYYRLNVMPVRIPPLRERTEDIPVLTEFFVSECAASMNKKTKSLDKETMDTLCAYSWPGNIRELRNVIERAMILCQGQFITSPFLTLPALPCAEKSDARSLKEVEGIHIKNILASVGQNRSKAAKILGISRSTLNERIKDLK